MHWLETFLQIPPRRFETARRKLPINNAFQNVVSLNSLIAADFVGDQLIHPMHRFYVAPKNWDPLGLALRGSEAHHARNVLRMQAGEKLVLFNGEGRELTAEIANVTDHEIRLRKLHESEMAPLRCRIVLGQAIPKGKNMDLIVQKAVEIGAAEIAPIISDRTIVQLDSESAYQNKQNGSKSPSKRPSNAARTGCRTFTPQKN